MAFLMVEGEEEGLTADTGGTRVTPRAPPTRTPVTRSAPVITMSDGNCPRCSLTSLTTRPPSTRCCPRSSSSESSHSLTWCLSADPPRLEIHIFLFSSFLWFFKIFTKELKKDFKVFLEAISVLFLKTPLLLQVCKAWYILALDGSNWQKVDLFQFQVKEFKKSQVKTDTKTISKKLSICPLAQVGIEGVVVENLAKKCGGFLKKLSLNGCQVGLFRHHNLLKSNREKMFFSSNIYSGLNFIQKAQFQYHPESNKLCKSVYSWVVFIVL